MGVLPRCPEIQRRGSRVRKRWGWCLFGWVPMGSRVHELGILALSGKTGGWVGQVEYEEKVGFLEFGKEWNPGPLIDG